MVPIWSNIGKMRYRVEVKFISGNLMVLWLPQKSDVLLLNYRFRVWVQ